MINDGSLAPRSLSEAEAKSRSFTDLLFLGDSSSIINVIYFVDDL